MNGELLQAGGENSSPAPRRSIKEIHEALCALANILDPLLPDSPSLPQYHRQLSELPDTRKLLMTGCIETAESGGLESLLFIASLPFESEKQPIPQQVQRVNLLEETCRSLASLSPLLLDETASSSGYSKWTDDILKALYKVSCQVETTEASEEIKGSVTEVQVNVLRAVGALAVSEPLKVRIVDRFLPYMLQSNTVRDGTDISDAASQAFQSLGFTDDEIAVKVAGNNPQLLADWFCLERSCLIQAMARQEIRQIVEDTWGTAFQETNAPTTTKLIREASDLSRSDDGSSYGSDLFDSFVFDIESASKREMMLQQYRAIYGERDSQPSQLLEGVSEEVDEPTRSASLLSRQIYPLNHCDTETEWILDHDRYLEMREHGYDKLAANPLSPHVEHLLARVFPSQLIRDHILPIHTLRPKASFNFRGLMMPQRRYFSFRREGQLLNRLCANEASRMESTDVYWTLGFTNSSFAGEFSESLVQALYLCPMIIGLSFSKTVDAKNVHGESEKEAKTEERGAILPNLAGSLPPWINSLTFDGIMNDKDLNSLVKILETMGTLAAGRQESTPITGCKDQASDSCSAQGQFCSVAVRRCLGVREDTWRSFVNLIGKPNISGGPSLTPLSSLRILDLSGNGLGDDLCASILRVVHDEVAGCRIEQLDLSGNRILAGTSVLNVINEYVDCHRDSRQRGTVATKERWKSSLHTLRLANNGLHVGEAWIYILDHLKNNALELQVLDLSSNGLILTEDDVELCGLLASSLLRNTCLCRLNLSKNKFSAGAIDHILTDLSRATSPSVLAFLQLDENKPSLSNHQRDLLSSFCSRSQKVLLQRFISERERTPDRSMPEASLESTSLHADKFTIPEESKVEMDAAERPSLGSATSGSLTAAGSNNNMITVLFSAPLVYSSVQGVYRPFDRLDLKKERDFMLQCLREASRDIDLSFDSATSDRLVTAISKRCGVLHYSGHGHPNYLPFENKGDTHWLQVGDIKEMLRSEDCAPFRFVFVSACHSEKVGQTFSEAGVPHVVCCTQESELKDTAALAFTRQFYLSLAVGNTVKESFDHGCKAVRATPNLKDAEEEMKKFQLLPADGDHNVAIFINARRVPEWPPHNFDSEARSSRRGSHARGRKNVRSGETHAWDLSMRNMMQDDPSPGPPECFLGREVEMFRVLRLIFENKLVSVIGQAGIGRSSLVCALCHYINERANSIFEIDQIYHVTAKITAKTQRRQNRTQALIHRLSKKLIDAGKLDVQHRRDDDIETMTENICGALKKEKALVVFDRVDLLDDSDETNEFPMFLKNFILNAHDVKVVLTNLKVLGIPTLREQPFELQGLNFGNTVRLFSNLCLYVHTPKERRKLYGSLVTSEAEEYLLPEDPNLPERVSKIFSMIGNGIPSKIEIAAYNLSKNDYVALASGELTGSG